MKLHTGPINNKAELNHLSEGDTATVFDIQRFSIHDGPGIRTTVFFKGCPLRCNWCQNPESHKNEPEMAFYREECTGCLQCRTVCPDDAILDNTHSRIDFSRCSACGRCIQVCTSNSLRMIGEEYNTSRLLKEVLRDRDFFVESGGGVTLSGGEPLIYSSFLQNFLPALKHEKIHVNVETCGYFQWENFEKILPFLDLVYFDLKHMDPDSHKEFTGVGNELILDNFLHLSGVSRAVIPRVPMIPGYNDSDENIRMISEFLIKNGHRQIHCLTYHKLGESKIPRIKTDLVPLNIEPLTDDYIPAVLLKFKNHGMEVITYE